MQCPDLGPVALAASRFCTSTHWGHDSHCLETSEELWTAVKKAEDACQEQEEGQ